MTFLDAEVDPNDVTVEIIGPELNTIPCNLNLKSNGGTCTFVPLIIGMYKVRICFPLVGCIYYLRSRYGSWFQFLMFEFIAQVTIFNGDDVIQGCPMFIRAMPEVSEIKHSGMEPCAVGSIVEVQVSFQCTFMKFLKFASKV